MNRRTVVRMISLILAGFLFLEAPIQTYAGQTGDIISSEDDMNTGNDLDVEPNVTGEDSSEGQISEENRTVTDLVDKIEQPEDERYQETEETEKNEQEKPSEDDSQEASENNFTDQAEGVPDNISEELSEISDADSEEMPDVNPEDQPETLPEVPKDVDKEKVPYKLSELVLSLVHQEPGTVVLTWEAVDGAQSYTLYRDGELLPWDENSDLTYEDTKLTIGEKHTYKIEAVAVVDGQEYTSETSVELEWDTSMQIPSVYVLEDGNDALYLDWEKAEGAEGYLICQMDGENSCQVVDTEELSCSFSDSLENGTEYEYEIWSYHTSEEQGRVFGARAVSVVPGNLNKIELKAEGISYKMIKLTWSKCETATGYRIYRKNDMGDFQLLKVISSGDILEYRDTGLFLDRNYEYKICPTIQEDNVLCEGPESDTASAKTVLGATAAGTVTCVNFETLELAWKQTGGAEGYEVYRSDAEEGVYRKIASVSAQNTTFRNPGLELEKTYYYKVRAYRVSGRNKVYGDFSPAVNGRTHLGQTTGLKATAVNYSTIKLTWNKVGAKRYQIYYSTEKDSGYQFLASVQGNSYQLDNVICGQEYYFKVRATGISDGKIVYGEYSSVASRKTTIATPSAKILEKHYNRIKFQWGAVAGAENYEVWWSQDNKTYQKLCSTNQTSYEHLDLDLGKTYYYKVRAIRQKYTTSFSKVISAKTVLGNLTGLKAWRNGEYITLSWNTAEGCKTYEIYRSTSPYGGFQYIGLAGKSPTVYTDYTASKYTTYYYKVCGTRDGIKTNMAGPVGVAALPEPKPEPEPGNRTTYGVDVSAYQGSIDWGKVKGDGIDFAILRIVTGGSSSTTKDTKFEANYSGARGQGIKVGVYRYSYAKTTAQARQEAQNVLSALGGRKLDFPIVMDVEDSSILNATNTAQRTDIILAFKDEVEKAGYKFAFYANLNWLNNYLDMNRLSNVDIWIARWRDLSKGHGYNGKGNVTMWQYTDSGSVNGISGKVDRDVCYKNY